MKLQCSDIAEKAFQQDVDLERLFVEMVEGLSQDEHSVGIGSNLRAGLMEDAPLGKHIRSLGFSGLCNGQWKHVVGMEHVQSPCLLDDLEALIRSFGRFCKIGNVQDLRISMAAFRTINKDFPADAFLECLAETAVNQELDGSGIGMIEMRQVSSRIDADLVVENKEIVRLTRKRIDELLRS